MMQANQGAFETGNYPNILREWGLSDADIQTRIDETWDQLFYGSDDTQRVYYPVGEDMAYVLDVNNADVRSEGMSYGMMIAVQLDKKAEFDRLWKWAKTYMYHADGPYTGYFSWHNKPDGERLDANPASDGETWFAAALFFAAARWGNGEGLFNYEAEANAILNTMLHTEDRKSPLATNMFDADAQMVVFVPRRGQPSRFTDPSYHTPHFYELWSRWAEADQDFWAEAAAISRAFWKRTAHPKTGLMPNYAEFDGRPRIMNDYSEVFYADSWRNAMNVAMDYIWFAADPWQVEQSNRWLNFFYSRGIGAYTSKFTVDGQPVDPQRRAGGLIAMNAVAAMVASMENRWEFVEEFWNMPIPSGQFRYYDGMLYMLALLQTSGNFRIYILGSVDI